jgi:peptide/nickel transport system permease protein
MLRFIARRLLIAIPVLIGLSVLIFLFVRALPGGPEDALLGERGTAETRAQIRESLGLNESLPVQYGRYVRNLLAGNLGLSVSTRRPIVEELSERFPATVELSLAAMTIALVAGVPLGFVAAKRYQGVLDNASLVASLVGISFPVFFLALLLKYIFSVQLGWLPTIGRLDVTRELAHPTNF